MKNKINIQSLILKYRFLTFYLVCSKVLKSLQCQFGLEYKLASRKLEFRDLKEEVKNFTKFKNRKNLKNKRRYVSL